MKTVDGVLQLRKEIRRKWETHRSLLFLLTRQELKSRYQGSVLGFAWAVATPLLMLGVYALVFGQIFNARWPIARTASGGEFAATLFAGLMVVSFISDTFARAPQLIVGQQNFVKKLVFPLYLLPVVLVLASLVHLGIAASLLALFVRISTGVLPVTIVALPVVILPVVMFAMGGAWILASLGVYFRDSTQVVGVALTALIYLSPVFFPVSAVPAQWQSIFHLNPLSLPIEQVRAVSLYDQWPNWMAWVRSIGGGALFMLLGLWWFNKTSDGFGDVL
ncbi:MAG: ABC transporter permease [Ramlibacter sp.]|nr:ABC transporter permease [Ramlibacter sp.]